MHSLRSLSAALPALAVVAGLTTGCGSTGGDSAVSGAVSATTTVAADAAVQQPDATPVGDTADGAATGSAETDATGTGSSETDTAAGDASVPTQTLAKATFPAYFTKGATVDVAIHRLKRRGRLLELSFSLTPHAPVGSGARESLNPYRLLGRSSFHVALIDTVNLRRHRVVKDSSGKELKPDDVWTTILLDQPNLLTYTFAAPPENVTKMDVHVANWPPFHDIPVEQ